MNTQKAIRSHLDERGSLVTDIIIGMAILSLVAFIAVSGYSQWRERGYAHAVVADTQRLADAVNELMVDPDFDVAAGPGMSVLPKTLRLDVTTIEDPLSMTGIELSPRNEVFGWKITSDLHFGFCIEHVPQSPGAWAAYRSDKGGIYAHGKHGGCQGPEGPDWSKYLPDRVDDEPSEEPSPTPSPAPTPSPSPTPTAAPTPTSAPTPNPSPTAAPAPSPTQPPRLWEPPTSAADIEALCSRNWGDGVIRGNGRGTIYGTPGNDIIFSGNGGQVVYGLGGDDLICGGNGKDTLHGGGGSDILFGGNGKDTLYGGPGVDYLHGNNGKDTMYVGDGFQDVTYGGNGKDIYLEDGPGDPLDTFHQGPANG